MGTGPPAHSLAQRGKPSSGLGPLPAPGSCAALGSPCRDAFESEPPWSGRGGAPVLRRDPQVLERMRLLETVREGEGLEGGWVGVVLA